MRRLRDVGVALAILAVLELSARVLGLGRAPDAAPVRFVNEESGWARAGVYYQLDPELFWKLRPSAAIAGGLYRTNSLGLRGAEVAVPKPEGTFRVALVGDSCTFGLGLDLPDTYGALLETLEGPNGERVEAVRLAVPGYSSLQSLWLAQRHLPRLEADAIVLYVGAFNDAAPACGQTDSEVARSTATVGLRTLLRHLALYRAIAGLVRDAPPRCPPPEPNPRSRVSLDEFRDNLRRLVRLSRGSTRRPGPVILVVPPVVTGALAEPYRKDVARIRGAITPTLGDHDFQADRIHPNRSGNVEIARRLASSLHLRGELDPRLLTDARRADDVDALLERRDPRVALAPSRDLAARHPERPRLAIALLRALLDSGATAQAVTVAAESVRRHPDVTELRRLYAEALAASGDDVAAERQIRAGLSRDRGWIFGRVVLARTLLARGDRKSARHQALRGLEVAPTSRELRQIVAGTGYGDPRP